jgi:predicted DNA-binding transcriptional regulator YafY
MVINMGKKKPKAEKRTDAERRARQSERLSRLLRVLHCIMGPGRWDADALARDLEVSPRTIHRIMQTLSMANIPWYFCKNNECYRVRPGFRFPGFEGNNEPQETLRPAELRRAAEVLANDLSVFLESLRRFCSQFD